MKAKNKIWIGVGAFVVAGSGAIGSAPALADARPAIAATSTIALDAATAPRTPGGIVVAQTRSGGEGGENEGGAKVQRAPAKPKSTAVKKSSAKPAAAHQHGGEGGESEGGESEGGAAKLPRDLSFGLKIALMQGHLRIGDELVGAGQWDAAMPHFLHPAEELYGSIRRELRSYKVKPFQAALKKLSDTVKAKKGGDDYTNALKAVRASLAGAETAATTKSRQGTLFVLSAAMESLRTATDEYEEAVVNGKIANPVEYQDARGFVWQAEAMIESVAPDLEKKNAEALKETRALFAELKTMFPSAMPPSEPVKDRSWMLGEVSRIELQAGKFK